MNFFKAICNMLQINNAPKQKESFVENDATLGSYRKEYFEDVDCSELLNLNKFLEDIQEPNTNKLENNPVEGTSKVIIPEDSLENKSTITINSDVSILNDIINISSDEEMVDKDIYSLEDDIPLNILFKNKSFSKNDVAMKFGQSSNIKLVSIMPCSNVIEKKTLSEFVSGVDYKIIDSSLNEEHNNFLNYDDDNGYHSSDFEFITESEAKSAGIIENKRKKNTDRHYLNKNTDHDSKIAFKNDNVYNDYRKNHVIPTGENYLKLFQGHYEPMMSGFMENKAFHVSKMSIDFEGVGFNTRMHYITERDDSEYLDEANKVALMIPRLYPNENRRKRRLIQTETK